jgi:hypothetical protein
VWGAISLFATSPWALAGAVLLVLVGIGWLVRRRLLRRTATGVQAEV